MAKKKGKKTELIEETKKIEKKIEEDTKKIDKAIKKEAKEVDKALNNINEKKIEKKVEEVENTIKKDTKEVKEAVEEGIKSIGESINKTNEGVVKKKTRKKFDNTVYLKDLTTSTLAISVCAIVFHIAVAVLLVFFQVYCIFEIKDYGLNGLKEDEAIVSFIEAAHSSGETGTSIISNYTNETEFIVFEITLPVLALIVTVIALTVFWKYLYYVFKDVKTDKQLFTKSKIELVKRMRNILSLSTLIFMLLFGLEYIVIWVVVEVVMEIVVYIFEYAVSKTE